VLSPSSRRAVSFHTLSESGPTKKLIAQWSYQLKSDEVRDGRSATPPSRALRLSATARRSRMPTLDQALVLAILTAMVALFVWDRLRFDLVALLGLITAMASGVAPPDRAFAGFGD
jgi:hypothetical protein